MDTCGEFIKLVGPDKFAGMRQDQNLGGWGASYNAGVQNMIIEGYWHPGETQIQKPEIAEFNRSSWAPVPASREGAKIMATGAHFVVLFKDGKHPDQMFKVAEFMVTDTALDIIFKEVGWIFGKTLLAAEGRRQRLSWPEVLYRRAQTGDRVDHRPPLPDPCLRADPVQRAARAGLPRRDDRQGCRGRAADRAPSRVGRRRASNKRRGSS